MHHYDPWIFGMLWENEHREELRRLASGRLARQVAVRPTPGSSGSAALQRWSKLGQVFGSLVSGVWPRLRRSPSKAS